jgi:hypothetical protein
LASILWIWFAAFSLMAIMTVGNFKSDLFGPRLTSGGVQVKP